MTIWELIEALKKCNSWDKEEDHINADTLLLQYIWNIEVKEAFHNIKKWY